MKLGNETIKTIVIYKCIIVAKKRIPCQDSYFSVIIGKALIRLNNVILYIYLHNFITIVTTTTIDVL